MNAEQKCQSIGWQFDNSYLNLPSEFFTRIAPTVVRAPKMIVFNDELARKIGLEFLGQDVDAPAFLAGNRLAQGSEPFAQAYAGHQFGGFSILGDGRAVVLGEHITPDGVRLDVQLKGSGPTPYSRRGEGRAALGPMLREYLLSESMHGLGIPTTRSLAVVATGESVYRQTPLPGAVLSRIASSHLRVGTFQYAAARGELAHLNQLLRYAIKRHYPGLEGSAVPAADLLRAVIDAQSTLIVHWMRVGFIHGVMNTDNMTISGETIDYGPCAFMDRYDPATVYSSIDYQGRYAFGNQPGIAQWNLLRLAESLLPLLDPDQDRAVQIAKDLVGEFAQIYSDRYEQMMLRKLGMDLEPEQADQQLVNDLLEYMREHRLDYTNTFYELSEPNLPDQSVYQTDQFGQWHQRWLDRLERHSVDVATARALMKQANPAYVPRNHLVEDAL